MARPMRARWRAAATATRSTAQGVRPRAPSTSSTRSPTSSTPPAEVSTRRLPRLKSRRESAGAPRTTPRRSPRRSRRAAVRDVGHQHVGVSIAEARRDLVLVVEVQRCRRRRPVMRCSSTRASSSVVVLGRQRLGSRRRRGRDRAARIQARACTSRSPPRPSFRSGSSAAATSPVATWRASTASASCGEHALRLLAPLPRRATRQRRSHSDGDPASTPGAQQRRGRGQVARCQLQRLGRRSGSRGRPSAWRPTSGTRAAAQRRGSSEPSCSSSRSRSLCGASSPRP